jgi:hypothetical protein
VGRDSNPVIQLITYKYQKRQLARKSRMEDGQEEKMTGLKSCPTIQDSNPVNFGLTHFAYFHLTFF